MGIIEIPQPQDIPTELRPAGRVKPRLPDVDPTDVPHPIGWRILVLPVIIPEETEGGIVLSADPVRHMELTRSVGVVLGVGDLAFSEVRGYPAGYAPVKGGDWVNFHSLSGQDMLIRDRSGAMVKMKYLNDNDIMGLPPKPEAMVVLV